MSEKQFEKLYEEYNESRPTASDDVRRTYSEMHTAFEEYLNAVCEDEFRNIFMFGYAYGMKAAKAEMQKGGAA